MSDPPGLDCREEVEYRVRWKAKRGEDQDETRDNHQGWKGGREDGLVS